MAEKIKGNLIIIGGAEDKHGDSQLLKKTVEIIGGTDANLVIITTATEKPETVGKEYRDVFERIGLKNIDVLNVDSRSEANSEKHVERIKRAAGIFFTGGDQLRITSILGGTKVYSALQEAYQRNVTIIGTSAGASVMSSTMIVNGKDNDPARKCTLKMAPGLGLLKEAIIDQHFDQRGRLGRLLCGVAENPHMLGIGIDEDTAIHVLPDAHFEVLGSNAVTILDGKSIESSNVSELSPDEILLITNITLHVLPAGYGYDMKERKVLKPNQTKQLQAKPNNISV